MKTLALCLAVLAAPALGAEISAADLTARLTADPPAIAVLGEVHDNPIHHENQAAAVAALKPRALVFEMLEPGQAARITPGLIADPAKLAEVLGWEASGWPDFAMYAPIFAAAPEARYYGAALPRAEVRRAFKEPLAQVFGPEAARYGLDQPYPGPLEKQLEAETQADHCGALPEDILPGMVAAQRLRDGAFARTTLQALAETGGPVALITGSGHARADRAVPALIRQADPGVKLLALGQLEAPAEGDQPFDLWIVTPAAEREDPCLAFRKP
ncbi:MAG: ChaN family lipoprotein [Paenirhodobacter sp.]|uniref:ChaN family lipoprotein n=1 Tax=Paenirhodobacter sp. TaxID=1965326 RepID=UPI003D0D155E